MSALKEVFVNVRPAVYGVISELEKCKSISEIKDLTAELRYWLDGDVLSVVNSLKARLRSTEKPVLSTVNSASSLVKSGDTPKMIIREMEAEEEEDMSGGCDSDEDNDCNRSVIDFTEVDALFQSSDYKATTTATPPTVLFSATVTAEPTVNTTTSAEVTVSTSIAGVSEPPDLTEKKEEKVLFSTVSQTKPISVSLDISSC